MDLTSAISSIHLFSDLGISESEQIIQSIKVLTPNKKEIIVKRSEHLHGLFGVSEGKLKIYLLSCGGQERIIRILNPGDSFGEAIMFNGIPSPVFVETLAPTKLLFVPKESVLGLMEQQPGFALSMLRSMSFLLKELLSDLESCCMQSAVQRIAYYLCEHCECDKQDMELPSTKANIASMLNLSAESFSRGLHQLADNGLISIYRRQIKLERPEELKRIALGEVKPGEMKNDS